MIFISFESQYTTSY